MAWPCKLKRRQRRHSPAQQRRGQARQAAPDNSNRSEACTCAAGITWAIDGTYAAHMTHATQASRLRNPHAGPSMYPCDARSVGFVYTQSHRAKFGRCRGNRK